MKNYLNFALFSEKKKMPPEKFPRPLVAKNINFVLTPFRPFDPFVVLRWF